MLLNSVSIPQSREGLASRILALLDRSWVVGIFDYPAMGQYVIIGATAERLRPSRRVGYCVQVRHGSGLNGSNLVFLRHPDGELVAHENQNYFACTLEQERLARQLFATHPENEPFLEGYRCPDGVHEIGFLVENSASRPSSRATKDAIDVKRYQQLY